MNRRQFVGLLGATPLACLFGRSAPALPVVPVQALTIPFNLDGSLPDIRNALNAALLEEWTEVACGSVDRLPIYTPRFVSKVSGKVLSAFSTEGIVGYMPDIRLPAHQYAGKHATTRAYVLVLKRAITPKCFANIEYMMTRPTPLYKWLRAMAQDLAYEVRYQVKWAVSAMHGSATGTEVSEVVAELPKIYVEKTAYMFSMFAYTMFGVPTTLAQLEANEQA
jgi:hypothetical protein